VVSAPAKSAGSAESTESSAERDFTAKAAGSHESHESHEGHDQVTASDITSGAGAASVKAVSSSVHSSAELMEKLTGKASDAPMCMTCGVKMRAAGSCYVCEGCGSTSGCS
jgi:ribonucleoside-diphosphate reductase alpha chain